jgi:glycosyltransferase involved in cell wall biosynthesis
MQAMAGSPVGGAEAFFERLAAALARAGVTQHLAIRRNPARAARLAPLGSAISQHRYGGAFDLCTAWELRREAKRFGPDVTLAWMSRAAHLVPRRPGVPVARLGGYYKLKYYRRCRHLIGNTPDICDYLVRQGWPRERTHYLPNFVDAAPLPPESRAAHATPDDALLLLGLGRLHWRKGFDVLIAALASLPHAYLWIAGTGPEQAELQRIAGTAGVADRVRWLGWRQDVGALYRAADVFVCPSRAEPLGNVVIEAWAHGAPVVATDTAGPAALIRDGATGLLVPAGRADAIAAAVARLGRGSPLAQGLREAGQAAYRAAFTEPAVVARYLEFFDRIRSG